MSVLNGITVVFTGVMSKKRADMEWEAKQLGAWVDARVTQGTDWLVTGKRTGKTKMNKAAAVGCKVITEDEYRDEIRARQYATTDESQESEPEMEEWRPTVGKPDWINKLKSGRSVGF